MIFQICKGKKYEVHCKKKVALRTEKTFQRVQPFTNPRPRLFNTAKPLQIRFLICSRVDRKTFFPPLFVSFHSHLNSFRFRYKLQMLEPISTVFATQQPYRNHPFRVLSTTQSTETQDFDPSFRNQRTLPVIISSFDVTFFLTQQSSS